MEESKKTELRIHTECNLTMHRLKDILEDIKAIEKEYNCNCTLIEINIIDFLFPKKERRNNG